MASLSCNHRSSRAAYLDVILISRRLKGLAGDLGPSPFPCDVYARATREAVQGFFVSNPQCQSGGLENKCFCCIVRTGNEVCLLCPCLCWSCCNVVVDPGSTRGQIGNRSSLFSFLLFRVLCRGTMQNYDTTETECAGNA